MADLDRPGKVPVKAADVEECLIEGQTLDHRGDGPKHLEDLNRSFLVSGVVGGNHDQSGQRFLASMVGMAERIPKFRAS